MGSVLAGGDYSKVTEKGILGMFRQEFEDVLGRGWSSQVGMLVSSNQETETYRWLGMTPALREWVGGRLKKGVRVEEFQISNRTFEATLGLPLDDLRRDKLGILRIRIGDLAARAAQHWESLLTTQLTTNGTCFDGQTFFSTAHVSGDSGTLSNDLAAGAVAALNVTTAASPTRDEMVSAIIGVITEFYRMVDDQGEPMNGNARSFMVMVPVGMYGAAVGAISDQLGAAGGTNTLLRQRFNVDVVANPRLSSATEFYIFRTDARARPLIMQEELPVQSSVIGAGSEHEFKNREWLFGVETIRNAGYGLWQHAMRATLS
jgi:phage major head subunit gpT-like protein